MTVFSEAKIHLVKEDFLGYRVMANRYLKVLKIEPDRNEMEIYFIEGSIIALDEAIQKGRNSVTLTITNMILILMQINEINHLRSSHNVSLSSNSANAA